MKAGNKSSQDPVLKINDLSVAYRQGRELLEAVRHVSIEIPQGQVCGLVGESGSGKTTLALAVMRYLPHNGVVRGGEIDFGGHNLLELSSRQMRSQMWGKQMALVPQDPLASLNPSMRLGPQTAEILRQHQALDSKEAQKQVLDLFEGVRLSDPQRVAQSYPHQLSGGMLQRVLIAMAISSEPRLLVMDEPTSSLDVTTEAAILDLLRDLIRGRGTSVLYITHNLAVTAQISDRVVVLYAGEVFEDAPTGDLFRKPLHPYTRGLLDCVPVLGQHKARVELRPIQGRIASLQALPEGCIFRPRCPLAIDVCSEHPPIYAAGEERASRCHRWEEIDREEVSAIQPGSIKTLLPETRSKTEPILEIKSAKVYFSNRRSFVEALTHQATKAIKAVNGVDLSIFKGRTLGLVGESGSGKTTLARAIVGLEELSEGKIKFLDVSLPPGLKGRSDNILCCLQIVFQNPDEALNPYMSVGETLRRPIIRLQKITQEEAERQVEQLLNEVEISPEYANRLPGELSGGQKQRVAIARAFAPDPELLIADEPVTSLDVSVQASILNLLNQLQAERGNSVLFISHDLATVGYIADDIAVMYLGQLMETSPSRAVFRPPYHPYTEVLLSSIPVIDPEAETSGVKLRGEIPTASEEISGCPFHTRCPRFLGDICVEKTPPWQVDEKTGKRIFCHIPLNDLSASQQPPIAIRKSTTGQE